MRLPRKASSVLLDISGRKVMGLRPSANDVCSLASGVYFLSSGTVAQDRKMVLLS